MKTSEFHLPAPRELPPETAARQRAELVAHVAAETGERAAERRARRSRTRALILAAAVALAVVAAVTSTTPALGLRDEIVRFLHGSPPPPGVERQLESQSESHFRDGVRGQIELRTSIGATVTLWTGGSARGECLGLSWSGTRRGGATCGGGHEPNPLFIVESGTRVHGAWIRLIFGTVAPAVDSLDLVAPDGRTASVPLSDGYFLAEVPPWPRPTYLVARAGRLEVARRELKEEQTPPDPLAPRRYLVEQVFAGREWGVYSYPAAGGRYCYGLVERTSGADEFHFVASETFESARLLVGGASDWPATLASPAVRSLYGLAPHADHIEIRLVDGSSETIPVQQGAFLYLAKAERPEPESVAAYGTDGTRLASQRVAG